MRQPPRAETGHHLGQCRRAGQYVACIQEPRHLRCIRRVARQIAHELVVQGQSVLGGARGLHLDLHPRHVDAGRALPPTALARHAELERLGHLVRRERVGAKLSGDREPQRVGAPARDILLVAGDAIARAHHAAGNLPAGAVVVAHLDRALEAAGGARIGRPVERGLDFDRAIVGRIAKQAAIVLLLEASVGAEPHPLLENAVADCKI